MATQTSTSSTITKALVKGEDKARKLKLIAYLKARQTLSAEGEAWMKRTTWK